MRVGGVDRRLWVNSHYIHAIDGKLILFNMHKFELLIRAQPLTEI